MPYSYTHSSVFSNTLYPQRTSRMRAGRIIVERLPPMNMILYGDEAENNSVYRWHKDIVCPACFKTAAELGKRMCILPCCRHNTATEMCEDCVNHRAIRKTQHRYDAHGVLVPSYDYVCPHNKEHPPMPPAPAPEIDHRFSALHATAKGAIQELSRHIEILFTHVDQKGNPASRFSLLATDC